MFTEKDNNMLLALSSKEDVKEVLFSPNLTTAPGMDGLTLLLYRECWDSVGSLLHEMVTAVWEGEALTVSQRTSLIGFLVRAKDAAQQKSQGQEMHVPPKLQPETDPHPPAGCVRRIHQAINKDRDTINGTSSTKADCALLDLDFIATFCYQTSRCECEWDLKVAKVKGLIDKVISRIKNVAANRISILVINNIPAKAINNILGTLS